MARKLDRREFLLAGGAMAVLSTVTARPWEKGTARVRVAGLKVDYTTCPLGLENLQPRFSWRLESDARRIRQSAYRILVADSRYKLQASNGNLWDSGKIQSRRALGIRYEGRSLASRQRCWWRVQVWDEGGEPSAPSEVSWWEMGLLAPDDWSAQWLTAEDGIDKADREAGLHWIWGEPKRERSTRGFRLKFQLPADSKPGELCAVTNDWSWWTQITRIWLDGEVVAGSSEANFDSSLPPTSAPGAFANWLPLKPLTAGEHVLAVEVDTADLTADSTFKVIQGLAVLARFGLQDGNTLRIGSEEHWKTQLVRADGWHKPEYVDTAWQAARAAPVEEYQPWPVQPARYLRREFGIEKRVSSARLYVTALGAYEARINGQRVSDALLTPEVSCSDRRALYQVHDVTELLKAGPNVLGLTVGDGWYASFDGRFAFGLPPRRVLAQLELTFGDGTRETVASGRGWRTSASPIRASEIRRGETYDARLEQPGWDGADFDDSGWQDAEIGEAPECRLVAQTSPPIRATLALKAHAFSQPRAGVYVFDFGQNFAGWCRLHTRGPAGTRVELRFAELLAVSGEVSQPYMNIGEPKCDVFILKGDPAGETFEPHFTYRGFRYVQVSGLAGEPTADLLTGVVVHSDLQVTGQLRSSEPLLEQLWRNTVWTQRSNFVAIPTDCPSREQRGWMADAGIFWDAAAFNMDIDAFTSRQMDNVVDAQSDDGVFPSVAPRPRANDAIFRDVTEGSAPGWSDGGVILPWTAWRRYGDLAIIDKNWQSMNRYLEFILNHNPDYIWRNKRGGDYGDQLSLDMIKLPTTIVATPAELTGTAYWAHSAQLLAQMAEASGRVRDRDRLREVRDRVRRAFNEAYVQADGTVGTGSQCGYILALQFGLLPDGIKQAAAEKLASDIRARDVSLTTGFLGTQFSLDVLADAGFVDLAYGLLLRTAFPSWGYMIRQGATTLWESWSGELQDGKTIMEMSRNHYTLGAVCGFLFRRMAGIDAATPGFETIVIRPLVDSRVRSGGGDYDSIMGRISTDWVQLRGGGFSLKVAIPANTTGLIHLPVRADSRLAEGGTEVSRRSDMRVARRTDREAIVEVGSGSYEFLVS